jgi:DNA-directed RNA polymerase specialized sigma24 family protein
MGKQSDPAWGEAWLQTVEPVIRVIVRRKLGVFLAQLDGQRENQDALELLSAIRLQLWKALTQEASIENFTSYAARVSYNTCATYFRTQFPRRASLKHRLRYVLTHRPAYALWETAEGELACGFASWRSAQRSLAEPAQVLQLRDAPLWDDIQGLSTRLVEHMQGND